MANSTEILNPRPERRRGCGAASAGAFELATSLPISGHNAVWKTDRNPPLTGHFPDRRRPDRSGLDTSHKAVSGQKRLSSCDVRRSEATRRLRSPHAGPRYSVEALLWLSDTSDSFCLPKLVAILPLSGVQFRYVRLSGGNLERPNRELRSSWRDRSDEYA